MITIFAVIVCGVILVVGVICLIVAFSSTKPISQQQSRALAIVKNGKGELPMSTSQHQNFDLITLPGGTSAKVPRNFDPDLIMQQLADIQHAPNIITAYVNELTLRFHANRQIKFIGTIEKYYTALAGGMGAQVTVLGQQLELIRVQLQLEKEGDIENQALEKRLYRGDLEKKLAAQEAEIARLKNVQKQSEERNKEKSDPYTRGKREVERNIAGRRGRQDGIGKVKQERDAKIQNILRGRDKSETSSFEQEEIRKLEKYYGTLLDEV